MTTRRDTGRAQLPALPTFIPTDPRAMASWAQKVAERLEVREGARGNPQERAVTLRELEAATAGISDIVENSGRPPEPGEVVVALGGKLEARVAIDKFVAALRETRLYKDLIKRLDDPSRFDHLSSELRDVLLRSIADEAAKRGAGIQRTELLIQDTNRSLARAVTEITAALGDNSAGIRELQATYVNQQSATATQVTQLEVSLGRYYQDGSAGRVQLEQELTTQASFTNGLRGQYTLKIQAGGALAGFGLAAQEVNGAPSSAFIISADKFAIVSPTYSGGLTNSPNLNHVPFGVDASGIYLNNNVYVRGQLRVDTGGRTLADGLRGSLSISAGGTAWSDTTARQAIWGALGRDGSALNNNHLVIGDTVTISGTGYVETRYWIGSAWTSPGAVINGNLLVNGSVAAGKIDTRGLTIRDAAGNLILGAGANLGAMARIDRIDVGNASTYIAAAAIGSAQIQDASISSAKIGIAEIDASHIKDLSVDDIKIKDGSVTLVNTQDLLPVNAQGLPGVDTRFGWGRLLGVLDTGPIAAKSAFLEVFYQDRALLRNLNSQAFSRFSLIAEVSDSGLAWHTLGAASGAAYIEYSNESSWWVYSMPQALSCSTTSVGVVYPTATGRWRPLSGHDHRHMKFLLSRYAVLPFPDAQSGTATWGIPIAASGTYTMYYAIDDLIDVAVLNGLSMPQLPYNNNDGALSHSFTAHLSAGLVSFLLGGRNTGAEWGIAAVLVDGGGNVVWHSRMASVSAGTPRFARFILAPDPGNFTISGLMGVKVTRK